jgi:hypothetical protein
MRTAASDKAGFASKFTVKCYMHVAVAKSPVGAGSISSHHRDDSSEMKALPDQTLYAPCVGQFCSNSHVLAKNRPTGGWRT